MSYVANILLRENLLTLIVVNDIDLVSHNECRMLFVLPFLDINTALNIWITLSSTVLLIEVKHLITLAIRILLLKASSDVFFLVATYYDTIIALIQRSSLDIWTRSLLL